MPEDTKPPPPPNALSAKPPSHFPALILMIDTGEQFVAKTLEDIPPTRPFQILQTKVKL